MLRVLKLLPKRRCDMNPFLIIAAILGGLILLILLLLLIGKAKIRIVCKEK